MKDKIERKLQVNHIDASVLLLFLTSEKHLTKEERLSQRYCIDYLQNKLRRFYDGVISIPSLGEVTKAIMDKELAGDSVSDDKEKQDIFLDLLWLMRKDRIGFWFPQMYALKIAQELIEEFRLEPADALHLACAYEDVECNTFVTLDTELIGNKYLEKKLGIRIVSPMQI